MAEERVLIIGPSNIGDAILASDVIATVHERFPQAHLTLVVGARAHALFADDPRIQTLVDADEYDSALGRLQLAWRLRCARPQIVVDLRHTLYPLLLTPHRAWRYLRQPPKTLTHMRDRHLWKLSAQVPQLRGVSVTNGHAWWRTDSDAVRVDGLWKRWQIEENAPVVVICPGARSHIKRWSSRGFAHVADRLISELRAVVIFSGEPDEEPILEEITAAMTHRAHSVLGLTTIRQLGLLMQHVQLVITNDSAALHLASSVGVPTLAVFGPTDERKYGPRASRHRTIRRQLFCTPCEEALCRFNHECMRFIPPEDVFTAAKELLGHG